MHAVLENETDTAAAMRGILALADVVCSEQYPPRKDLAALNATAPQKIRLLGRNAK